MNPLNLRWPIAREEGEEMDTSENFVILEYTVTESLQVTPKGRFCLLRVGDIPYDGEEIKEVTPRQAHVWLRKHDPQGKYMTWEDTVRVANDWALKKGM